MLRWFCISAVLVITGAMGNIAVAEENNALGLYPVSLRCEYVENPLGVDMAEPRLFWNVESKERGQKQTAYQILVSSSAENLDQGQGDLWDSGKIASDETAHVLYKGKPLLSSQEVFWKIRVWDKDAKLSAWSKTANWTMGVLAEADWKASWIGAKEPAETLLLRKEFTVKPQLKRAVVHVCGLGQYEVTFNGVNSTENLLTPGWTKYDKTCLYESYNITSLLKEGSNAAGLFLANGMYNVKAGRYTKFTGSFGPLKAIAQILLEYNDGTSEIIGTDENWRVSPGPITFSSVYGGEDYDARLEQKGWDKPGFADSKWRPAEKMQGPGGALKGVSCSAPPIRKIETLKTASIKEIKPGTAVYDLGQNVSLIPRIQVKGKAGSIVRITPAELIKPDGSVDRRSCGGGECYWQYTLAGEGAETWFPKFFYHGSRYLQVECKAVDGGDVPVVELLEGVVVHSSSDPVGEFSCSNELFNRIRTLIRWAQRSNLVHVITDCPHRERLGWLEQYHLNGPSLRYEFNLAGLFTKGMNDMADSQLANGLVPDIAPEYVVFSDGFRDSPEWGSAYILSAWQQYEWTGDTALLQKYYEGMKRYVAFLGSRSKDYIVSHGLGDWCDLGPNSPGVAQLTPIAVTATAFYYVDASLLAKIASLMNKEDDVKTYTELAEQIRKAFNKTFFHPETGQYATGSQCSNALALVMDIAEPKNRDAVLQSIVNDVRKRGNALTPGDVGYRYLLKALAEGGRSDVIFDMNNQSDKPGYGYQLNQGATSLVETWDARKDTSWNHFMLGHIMEWFYHDLAGIGYDPSAPGYKKISIKPQPVGDITWAKASLDSIQGKIVSSWSIRDKRFILNVTIPANTAATIFMPAKSVIGITESGAAIETKKEIAFQWYEAGYAVYKTGSGNYEFSSPW